MSLQPNDVGQVPRCACGARILTPPDMECPLCAMQRDNEIQGTRGIDGTGSPTREP